MIVVVGRPVAVASSPGDVSRAVVAGGPAVEIARAAVRSGATAEVVGSIGDDPAGDAVVVDLGRCGVGHAALLRDPATPTPTRAPGAGQDARRPRLDAADLDLGLEYLLGFSVLVLAEPLPPDVEAVALSRAVFAGAAVVALVPDGAVVSPALASVATVLGAPEGDSRAFPQMVGHFAAELDRGADPAVALATAATAAGWEPTR